MTQNALIIGASGGIGAAVAQDLETRGWQVTRLSRAHDGLDISDQANVDAHLEAQNGPYELVFMASGVLAAEGGAPEKALSQIRQESFEEVFKVNTFGVAYVLRHVPKLLPKKGRSVLAVLTARVGSIGDNNIGGWHAYRASKAAANQLLRGAAIELGRSHKEAIAVALHPGLWPQTLPQTTLHGTLQFAQRRPRKTWWTLCWGSLPKTAGSSLTTLINRLNGKCGMGDTLHLAHLSQVLWRMYTHR